MDKAFEIKGGIGDRLIIDTKNSSINAFASNVPTITPIDANIITQVVVYDGSNIIDADNGSRVDIQFAEDYGIQIGNSPITSANIGDYQGVTYDPVNKALILTEPRTLTAGIVVDADSVVEEIVFSGDVSIVNFTAGDPAVKLDKKITFRPATISSRLMIVSNGSAFSFDPANAPTIATISGYNYNLSVGEFDIDNITLTFTGTTTNINDLTNYGAVQISYTAIPAPPASDGSDTTTLIAPLTSADTDKSIR